MLVKDKWFTLVAATALGLGIGVNTTVFSLVNAVLIRGLPFPRSEEIVYLATRNTTRGADDSSPASWREFEDWRAKSRSYAAIAAFRQQQFNLSDPDHPAERASGAGVTANLFGLLGQTPVLGRDFAPGEDAAGAAPVVIIGHSIWKNRYDSDPAVIGRTLKLNEAACTIIGVMPPGMRFPTNADLWRPLTPPAADARQARNINVFGRLAPGVSWNQAASEMTAISKELEAAYPDTNKDMAGAHDDVQPALQRRADPAHLPGAARRGRLRAAHRLRQRRQPAARALGVPRARDGRPDCARRRTRDASSGSC